MLRAQSGADGSFSLYSERFQEGFHGAIGALNEARLKFVGPAQLQRFSPGCRLVVVDVAFGLGTNSASLLEAAGPCGLELTIHGLELDPTPLCTALAAGPFRQQWQPRTLLMLEQLCSEGQWHEANETATLHWGDARRRLMDLLNRGNLAGQCDLVLLDAFSPQRCPELWTLDFLGRLARLLKPDGRLLTYCSAAAVRHSLQQTGLELASIRPPLPHDRQATRRNPRTPWSYGTAASPTVLPLTAPLTPLTPMELEHLTTRAAEPFRDPEGSLPAKTILESRRQAQAASSALSTSAWRRRWGLERTA